MSASTFPQFTAEKSLHTPSRFYIGETQDLAVSSEGRDKVLPQIFVSIPLIGDYNCNEECYRIWVCAGSTNNCWWDLQCDVVCNPAPNFYD
jgi:hypothetical protein